MTEPAWKKRLRAMRFSFPEWARERPERIVYGANHEGTFEVYALEPEAGIPFEEYRDDAGHGSMVVAEQIKQLALQLDFAAKHVGTTPAIA